MFSAQASRFNLSKMKADLPCVNLSAVSISISIPSVRVSPDFSVPNVFIDKKKNVNVDVAII